MNKILIHTETRLNTFPENSTITNEEETHGEFNDLSINSNAAFNSADAKFNNWHYELSKSVKKYNKSQINNHITDVKTHLSDPSIVFDDFITNITNPIFFIDFEIIKIEHFVNYTKVLFKINKYIVEGAKIP